MLPVEQKAEIARQAALEKKASDLLVLDLRGLSSFTDLLMICGASSPRQVVAICDAIDEALGAARENPLSREGYRESTWIVLDYGDLVIHIFEEERRVYYDLERLWNHAPVLFSEQVSYLRESAQSKRESVP